MIRRQLARSFAVIVDFKIFVRICLSMILTHYIQKQLMTAGNSKCKYFYLLFIMADKCCVYYTLIAETMQQQQQQQQQQYNNGENNKHDTVM